MESSIETTIAIILFLLVVSWAIFSVTLHISAKYDQSIKDILTENASLIKNFIIINKKFYEPPTNPSFYGINLNVEINIEIKEFIYDSQVKLIRHEIYPKNFTIPKFIDKGEAIGAYLNSSLILVKVIVYGLP